jgi:hypothetical protein
MGKEEGIIVTMEKVIAILSVYFITHYAMKACWGVEL